MAEREIIATSPPLFSIIIAVCDDWAPLDQCLRSLEQEANGPRFEVIVTDDGSSEAAPDFIHGWAKSYPLTIIRQDHSGISIARNGTSTMSDQNSSVSTPASRMIFFGAAAWISDTPKTRSSTRAARAWLHSVTVRAAGTDSDK